MWLITTLIASVIVTAAWRKVKNPGRYKLDLLALMLWGTFVMILVDHTIAFLNEGGEFIEITTDGLIASGAVLGIAMIIPLLLIWTGAVFMRSQKN